MDLERAEAEEQRRRKVRPKSQRYKCRTRQTGVEHHGVEVSHAGKQDDAAQGGLDRAEQLERKNLECKAAQRHKGKSCQAQCRRKPSRERRHVEGASHCGRDAAANEQLGPSGKAAELGAPCHERAGEGDLQGAGQCIAAEAVVDDVAVQDS